MLHTEAPEVRAHLLKGNFGLERETLRITEDGFLSQTPHPFAGDANIVRDFSENQVEINTGVNPTPKAVVAELAAHDARVRETLLALPQPEYLWPFSNPPYIRGWQDIPVARFHGEDASKTAYREYLSDRYGRYKMALSGIHFNYSFSDELLEADFACSPEASLSGTREENFRAYKDRLYIRLTENAVAYGWLMTVLTAASPLMDSSYIEKHRFGEDAFRGLATPRCSEMGYWNYFTPVLDYSSAQAYDASIRAYVQRGLIASPSELYYPVRLKPRGNYNVADLSKSISHIELRMFDLNPLFEQLINVEDVFFAQLFLVWLATLPPAHLSEKDQIQAAQNFKYASHYDLKTVVLVMPDGSSGNAINLGRTILAHMRTFYESINAEQCVLDCLAFQESKLVDAHKRYAIIVREQFANTYMSKGIALARSRCN